MEARGETVNTKGVNVTKVTNFINNNMSVCLQASILYRERGRSYGEASFAEVAFRSEQLLKNQKFSFCLLVNPQLPSIAFLDL